MKIEEYKLLDSGECRKLEQVGPFRIIRPALNAFWRPHLPEKEWLRADAILTRDSRGNGHWEFKRELPEKWQIRYAGFNLAVKTTAFGHLGFFAEQYRNWKSFETGIASLGKEARALNLFAYSGIGSMAMARGGAMVTHLDAARGMVEWAQETSPSTRIYPPIYAGSLTTLPSFASGRCGAAPNISSSLWIRHPSAAAARRRCGKSRTIWSTS